MDELEISGKRYISTRRAAREHGYHSDYMGQLIRGKKVAGQKVGRAWYIEEDSLNVYLGKAPAVAAAAAEAPAPAAVEAAPAPVERLIIEEPAVAAAVPQPTVVPVSVPDVVAHAEPQAMPPVQESVQPVVHMAPVATPVAAQQIFVEPVSHVQPVVSPIEQETRIPIHTPASPALHMQEMGGLRYAADDSPSIPLVARMPQTPAQAQMYTREAVHAPRTASQFPYISLSIVAVLTLVAATFASNFVSATIVSEQGKAATVHYAIHW